MTTVPNRAQTLFDLTGRVAIVTGGAGLLGYHHGAILSAAGAHVVLLDLAGANPALRAEQLTLAHGPECLGLAADITSEASLEEARDAILAKFGRIDILINNAANNPKVESHPHAEPKQWSRLENFPLKIWNDDIAVGLTGAFLCSRIFGQEMVKRNAGVILNVASDLGVIAPDQRLYRKEGLPEDQQPVKPVTYSVVKTALIGLTRYLSTYWTAHNIRVNAISPGGVFADQPDEFTSKLHQLIPMGRMAHKDEYQGAILFLCSDASSYMTGQNLIVDGGRSVL
ncbi:SDR family oxidoreductase [Granulicella mallensis]|uniref:3-oxoacyl-(Acyl-carrier-protein) reductase n=1 Tax=Granulicella mallensis (strain ATCC BAA-1857 / DSM 23137 / MP5ACTX8) TaxID=682795 RepID=G8NUU4_GRAMM|nr:SDR family oxidoreductase [Granulicella mallensis]AEU37634.1 3-oxoacyl-(acyl-carrier-protein) reductase [Granulicella mallensis MP5ACTX8]